MSIFGGQSAGARLERMQASPRYVDGAFRNLAAIAPGLKHAALPSRDPRPAWSARPETGCALPGWGTRRCWWRSMACAC
jgi:hypothetical protein